MTSDSPRGHHVGANVDVSDLRAKLDAANAQTWTVRPEWDGALAGRLTVIVTEGETRSGSPITRRVVSAGPSGRQHWIDGAEANIALIATAVSALPSLLDRIELLERDLRDARANAFEEAAAHLEGPRAGWLPTREGEQLRSVAAGICNDTYAAHGLISRRGDDRTATLPLLR